MSIKRYKAEDLIRCGFALAPTSESGEWCKHVEVEEVEANLLGMQKEYAKLLFHAHKLMVFMDTSKEFQEAEDFVMKVMKEIKGGRTTTGS